MLLEDEFIWYICMTSLLKVYSYFTWRSMKKSADTKGNVSKLTLYPLKSMGGVDLKEAQCTHYGLKDKQNGLLDRLWMLTVGDNNQFITARQEPRIIQVQVNITNSQIQLKAPEMDAIFLSAPKPHANRSNTKVHGDPAQGIDCGSAVAEWFDRYLGCPGHHMLCNNPDVTGGRLIQRKPKLYTTNIQDNHKLLFHDDGPYLLTTEASLQELQHRLPNGSNAITMEYFRPTIVVSGDFPPFDEDTWDIVWIGDVRFRKMMLCGRCLLTTIDPLTGTKRADGEPLKTLKSFRVVQKKNDSPCFGIYLVCDIPGEIKVDDEVCVLKNPTLTEEY